MQLDPGLLASILADPDDDVVRLIAADWLDDHGEGERAEFIRLQIELTKDKRCKYPRNRSRPTTDGLCYPPYCTECRKLGGRPNADAIRKRERHLLLTCAIKWGSPHTVITSPRYHDFGLNESGLAVEFRRGFIEAITCSWQDWLTHNEAIRAATPLREVSLTTWPDIGPVERLDDPHYGSQPVHGVTRRFTHNELMAHLAERWPKITFHLPERTYPTRDAARRVFEQYGTGLYESGVGHIGAR